MTERRYALTLGEVDASNDAMPAAAPMREAPVRQAPTGDAYFRFLEEAERLFAEHGYNGTSIRAIANAANASLGTLHQYWRSKRVLFEDIFRRRFGPIHEERVQRLREIQARTPPGQGADPEDLVRALMEPLLLTYASSPQEARLIRGLLGRALTDPAPEVADTMRAMAAESFALLSELLRGACPHLDPSEFASRFNCVFSASMFLNIRWERAQRQLEGDEADWARVVSEMVYFLSVGLKAPPMPR